MARTTKQLSGAGKDKFLRGIIASEAAIPSAAAEALGEKMSAAIADIRVRREAWEESRSAPVARPSPPSNRCETSSTAVPQSTSDPTSQTASTAFDPFAFSALAVLTKKGRTALARQLAEIDSADQLHALAAAQHLTVDSKLRDLDHLREALVSATEARLAERKAAGS